MKNRLWGNYLIILLINFIMTSTKAQEMQKVPEDVLLSIFRKGSPKMICTFSGTCRQWQAIAKKSALWEDPLVIIDTSFWSKEKVERANEILTDFINAYPVQKLHMVHQSNQSQFIDLFLTLIGTKSNWTHLTIENLYLGCEYAEKFSFILQKMHKLTSLSLIACNISDYGTQYIMDAIKTSTSLSYLSLRLNRITEVGAQLIADVIKDNNTLLDINLAKNEVKSGGAKNLIMALKTNSKLEILNLENNEIEYKGLEFIASNLHQNHTLKNLYIRGNYINEDTRKLFCVNYQSRIIMNLCKERD